MFGDQGDGSVIMVVITVERETERERERTERGSGRLSLASWNSWRCPGVTVVSGDELGALGSGTWYCLVPKVVVS